MTAPARTPSEIRDSLLKWIVLALLVLSGVDLKPASATELPTPAAVHHPATHR